MAAENKRLDVYMFENGYADSRAKAGAMIMAGQVYVNSQKITKAGYALKKDDKLEIKGDKLPFVSRGGLKLDKAIKSFGIVLEDKVCMDIGASTGGFTDCMLQNKAKKVYSVDVGYGQLAWKLRTDERVVNMERTNFRYINTDSIAESLGFASVDVSFISLKKILPVLFELLDDNACSVCLIKPQFEAGKEKVGKKGVVRDISTHKDVVRDIMQFAFESGYSVLNLDFSPVKGPEGNIEYLMYIKKEKEPVFLVDNSDLVVDESHFQLNSKVGD